MREIKFRGKRIDNGKWVYGSLIIEEDPITDALKYFIKPFNFLRGKIVAPKTVGQYTGRKDKNGKEIYEGDIVRYSDGYTAVVVWKDTGFGLEFIEQVENPRTWYYLPNGDVLEILGNIYENPELIVLLSDDA